MAEAAFGIRVPDGDPGALEGAVGDLRQSSGAFERSAATLRDSSTAPWWIGTASLSYANRCVNHADAIAAGGEVMQIAAGIVNELAAELRTAKKLTEAALEDAKQADSRRQAAERELEDAQADAAAARYRAVQIDQAAAMTALTGTPDPFADAARSQALADADAADQRAATAERARDRAIADLQDAKRAGNKAEQEYENAADSAAGKIAALVGLLPEALGATSIPAGYTGGPGAPAPVAPMGTSATPPPPPKEEDDGGGFWNTVGDISGWNDAKAAVNAIADGDIGGALMHGAFAVPVGPGKFGKLGKMALSGSDEAATTVTRNLTREGVQAGSRKLPANLVAKLPDGRVILRTDEAGRIIPPPQQEIKAIVGDARQGLDEAAEFQQKLEGPARTLTGDPPIRSKKHAAMEALRLVAEQLAKLGS
jgi:hypothetical protein